MRSRTALAACRSVRFSVSCSTVTSASREAGIRRFALLLDKDPQTAHPDTVLPMHHAGASPGFPLGRLPMLYELFLQACFQVLGDTSTSVRSFWFSSSVPFFPYFTIPVCLSFVNRVLKRNRLPRRYRQRTPAMAAGLTSRRWTVQELLRLFLPLEALVRACAWECGWLPSLPTSARLGAGGPDERAEK